jgi:hypothetical protein
MEWESGSISSYSEKAKSQEKLIEEISKMPITNQARERTCLNIMLGHPERNGF